MKLNELSLPDLLAERTLAAYELEYLCPGDTAYAPTQYRLEMLDAEITRRQRVPLFRAA